MVPILSLDFLPGKLSTDLKKNITDTILISSNELQNKVRALASNSGQSSTVENAKRHAEVYKARLVTHLELSSKNLDWFFKKCESCFRKAYDEKHLFRALVDSKVKYGSPTKVSLAVLRMRLLSFPDGAAHAAFRMPLSPSRAVVMSLIVAIRCVTICDNTCLCHKLLHTHASQFVTD